MSFFGFSITPTAFLKSLIKSVDDLIEERRQLTDRCVRLQAESDAGMNYRQLWEAAAKDLRAANKTIAKLEKKGKK